MKKQGLQQEKTRWTHYQTGYHFVWIPKYRKKILVGEVQKELKRLIHECAQKNGLSIIAIETDIDHVHVFVSAPPRYAPALIANLLKVIPQECYVLNFLFSKESAEKISFGHLPIMLEQQVLYPQKRLFDISQSAKGNSTLSSQSPKGDENFRVSL